MNKDVSKLNSLHLTELLSVVGVGTWDWDLTTGKVIYSAAWAKLLGYELKELKQVVETWEKLVLPEDLEYANMQIGRHLSGEKPLYEAEFRMLCKDGSIIWAQDKGRVTEYDQNGRCIRFMGVLQNVTRLKDTEMRLLENQETLDLAVNVAELGTWDWDIPGNFIRYNDEYLRMLGYSQEDIDGSIEEWEAMNHPEDLQRSHKMLNAYIDGKIPSYECEIRMKHRDGTHIWTRDVGKIVARDSEGNPVRLIGGHLNIDVLKTSERQLKEALQALEDNNLHLESEIEIRTKELVEQDKMLWTVNQISRKLLAFHPQDNFEQLVQDCLRLLGESINKNRIYIWKDRTDNDGNVYCTQLYEWVRGAKPIQGNEVCEETSYDELPTFSEAIDADQCLNSLLRDMSESEKRILGPKGIKTILIAPIAINGKRWGFIGVDNCDSEQLFTSIEENMLLMSGSMLANTIDKMETEARMREMEERTQIMLNATPLCCNLWTPDLTNMSCNDEAVRLFGLSSQEEYLERFNELSPEYQMNGRRSEDLAAEYILEAFQEGYCRFEWMHQKLDGTPVPAEITLVRIKHRDGFIVSGYTRDLREEKAMLLELQTKEDDLRTARDEALLSSKAKSNFLANMSHEIRTPMNAISGLAEIILRESAGEKSAEYAKGIKGACNNLLNIINDILDISKIESGKLEIFTSQYELASLLHDVITISRMRLGSKPLMFITDIDSRLPAQLIGDEIRIKQILINILSNAIKFTQEGYISLRVSGIVEGDKATLCFSVKDSGMGIRKEDLQRLFAEFERVNTTKNRSIEGTGLGLAISKRLCEMMNGTIQVQSIFEQGSEFIITIPQECPSYEPLAKIPNEKRVLLYEPRDRYRRSIAETLENLGCIYASCANQSDLYDNICAMPYDYILTAALHLKKVQSIVQKNELRAVIAAFADFGEEVEDNGTYTILFPVSCLQISNLLNGYQDENGGSHKNAVGINFVAPSARVLVVDDNQVNLQVAKGLMEPYEFTVDTAENGLEAVEMVKHTQYDLVFMDHMMPEMDGIDATIAIRQMDGQYYKELPIIALTANALVGTREMFIREGMNDFLAKPIEINKLGQVLAKWMTPSKMVKSVPRETTATVDNGSWSIDGVNTAQGILSVGGDKENYLQILTTYFADGNQKCTTLLQHVREKDINTFRTEIHALKSTSATIGALEISTFAAKLESAAQHGDVLYIDDNLDGFLSEFRAVLEGIRPILSSNNREIGAAFSLNDDKPTGDMVHLKEKLDALYDAAEFANIGQMEAVMKELKAFKWPKEIHKELHAIQECSAMFDYDGILECINHIKKS